MARGDGRRRNLIRDEQPTHIAAAFDVSRQTFRAERYAEYKANREAMPEPLARQIEPLLEKRGLSTGGN